MDFEIPFLVTVARVHADGNVSRRRRRGGVRQQRQSTSEQCDPQGDRSEQGPERGDSRRTEGNGHSTIQVRFSHLSNAFYRTSSFVTFLEKPTCRETREENMNEENEIYRITELRRKRETKEELKNKTKNHVR